MDIVINWATGVPASGLMLTQRAAQLLILAIFLCSTCCGLSQQLPSSAVSVCSGAEGPTGNLGSLTAQQLAEGRLASSIQSSWDFGIGEGALHAAADRNLTLACIIALNTSVSRPTGSAVFLRPAAIDLGEATGLNMENVLLVTSCSAVLGYQDFFCSSYSVAGSLTLKQGAVHFSDWRDGFTTLRNVTLACPDPEAAPPPPCWLVAVQTAGELLAAFLLHTESVGANVTIVLAANISIAKSSWPDTPVAVSAHVQLVGSSRLSRPVLDFQLLVDLWQLLPEATVSVINLTCVNLAPTYLSPAFPSSVFAVLSERVWAFSRTERQLHIIGSTLVVPSEELLYMRRWLTYLSSPVPEDKAKAAWMNMIDIKILQVNGSGVYYDTVTSFTTTYNNVRITDTLGPGYPLLPVNTGLLQALGQTADLNVPLTAVRQIVNASDLLIALLPSTMQPDSQDRRWLLMVANFSLSDVDNFISNAAAAAAANRTGAVDLPGSAVVGMGAGLRVVRLGFGRSLGALGLPSGVALVLRGLTLGGLPARAATYDPQSPLDALASPLWGLALAEGAGGVSLENVTLLISASELRLLQQCLLPASSALPPSAPYDGALTAAVRAFFTASRVSSYNASYLRLSSGATQRFSLTGVTFRVPVAADGEGDAPEVVAPGAGGGGGLEGWEVGVLVGCLVGGVLLAGVLAGVLLAARRRRQQYRGAEEGDVEKYRDGEHAPGGTGVGGGGSMDLANPYTELTNSSQVLQQDARRSDLEAAARSKAGSGTVSASASGGIGNVGRSMSTTIITSHDTSSGAGLLPGAGGSGAAGAAAASYSGGGRAARTSSQDRPPTPPGAATGADGHAHGHSMATDSFERPPSNTVLGQHGPVGRLAQRLGSAVTAGGSSSSVPSSSVINQTQSILATGGGAGALEQMHQLIQVLGRDFNDKQLEVQGLLGKGAHGTVYRGVWRGLPVAVKSMVFSNDSSARQQSRALMEAAISANLAHPNIVTTYSYELREVEHELASISPELARQGGGWRLLIIQEYCDAGPLRRIVDCGFFLTPPKPACVAKPKIKLPSVGLMRKDSPSGEGSASSATRADATVAAASSSRGSSGSSSVNGNGGRASPGNETATAPSPGAQRAGAPTAQPRPLLDSVPSDVPGRPASSLQSARRYVEAALMIARGLQHIHDKNIVHGDLNPNNVLLMRAPGTPLGFCLKVADFGLSVRLESLDSHMSNLFQGSPYYCAPEVVLSGKVGKSADIYSLGVVLWELQNGTRPLWRAGVRLRTYPSLNTAELDFLPDAPARYVRLARDCLHGSKDARPRISVVVEALEGIKAELEAM